jgi:predicted dehydrogenase
MRLNGNSASVPVRVGMAGMGYWGANFARNLDAIEGCELAWICDPDEATHSKWRGSYSGTVFTTELDDLLADPSLDAIAITSPVPTHAALAKRVLDAGKHCFVEKPLAQNVADAEDVVATAAERDRLLMVGHLLEYHPAVEQLRDLISSGELGEILYLYSQRLNLGRIRADENALWSLGAHDVSVLLSLAGELPTEASARGQAYIQDGVEDVVFGYLQFPSGMAGHLHLSWLDPHKTRKITVVGSQRMATLDDMEMDHKLKIYDKGFDPHESAFGDREYVTRSGTMHSPPVPSLEPLRVECEHFVDCVRTGTGPRSNGQVGARVVRVLEALQSSLDSGGAPQPVGEPAVNA